MTETNQSVYLKLHFSFVFEFLEFVIICYLEFPTLHYSTIPLPRLDIRYRTAQILGFYL